MPRRTFLSAALTAAALLAPAGAGRADDKPRANKPRVEVVFCLDTTGSMGGLIQHGNDAECMKRWKAMCAKAEGSYAQIAQAGGVVAVATPCDKRLAEINGELTRSTLVYGTDAKRGEAMRSLGGAGALPPAAAAD